MTDYHTHILPKMDDGASSVEESIAMLRMEAEQGVTEVALTPHFYGNLEEPSSFLLRRSRAYDALLRGIDALPKAEQESLPRLRLGAEAAWVPNMMQWSEPLCYDNSACLLIEPPFGPWGALFFNQLYELMSQTGITPVIAHIDRYWGMQNRKQLAQLLDMGVPLQLSAESLLHRATRRIAVHFIKSGAVRMVISDAHNLQQRKPNLLPACSVLMERTGEDFADVFEFSLE